MLIRHVFALLLFSLLASGCNVLDSRSSPSVMTVPPYWQSQNHTAQDQMADLRAFHEKESSNISEDLHVFRNREVERMAAESKEMKKSAPRQENQANGTESKESWAWLNWFNKKNKG
ncbi:MAG: hypothetical protein FWG73_05670 [Planctomycetaceae bacterium]|nr:hypothetical protein [Planctomycetaceae bacterium]